MKEIKIKLDIANKKCKVEAIWDNAIYEKELKSYSPGLYYLVAWKSYFKEKNT